MREFDPGDGRTALIDRGHEVVPEQREIVTVRLLELGVLVHLRFAIFARIERPAVAPTDMEDSIRAVKVGADRVFLGGVAAGTLMWSRMQRQYRRNLFSKHALRRVAALGYLVDQIEQLPNVEVRRGTEVSELIGGGGRLRVSNRCR